MASPHRHPAHASVVEPPPVRASRFIGQVFHVVDEAQIAAHLAEARGAHPKANHHVFAWRLGHPTPQARASDDGEPRHTAGPPLLRQLEGRELTDALVIVVRYFGGTKLGTGGLIRAYGGAASAALDAAGAVEVVPTVTLEVRHPYPAVGAVRHTLGQHGLTPASTDFGAAVTVTVEVPLAGRVALEADLVDATAGAAEVEVASE